MSSLSFSQRAVLVLGENGTMIERAVTLQRFSRIQLDFIFPSGSGSSEKRWHNFANSIVAARAAFPGDKPLIIVRADQLYDWRLLRKIADAPFAADVDAFALIDTAAPALEWAAGNFCAATCKNGRCHALAKVLRNPETGRAVRCGHRLGSYDAVVAGDVYATKPRIFAVLARLFASSIDCTIADSMQELAQQGLLGCIDLEELSSPPSWFASRTIAALAKTGDAPPRRRMPGQSWAPILDRARELLAQVPEPAYQKEQNGGGGPCGPCGGSPREKKLFDDHAVPLLQLGPTLGRGANCLVVEGEGEGGADEGKDAAAPSRLAIKMFNNVGHSQGDTREVMWEVHVLRQLRHENIVRLCDVVELADAVYLVMERVEGPDLQQHLRACPNGILPSNQAQLFFCHVLAALRHAHTRGFLHCDLKPANVRLSKSLDRAVLVDWGMARQLDAQPKVITQGTPSYASPEQLTGYDCDVAWGTAKLHPAADVWALGATLYEMVCGKPPFSGDSFESLVANVIKLNYTLPDRLSLQVRQLIDSCLRLHPSDRASIEELCQDPWVAGSGYLVADPELKAMGNGNGSRDEEAKKGHDDTQDASGVMAMVQQHWKRGLLFIVYSVLLGGALYYCNPSGAAFDLEET